MASLLEEVVDAMKARNALLRAKNRPEWRSMLLGTLLGLTIGIIVISVAAMCFTVDLQHVSPARILSRKSWSSIEGSPAVRTVGVILDDSMSIQQKDMMAAVQAAAEYISEQRPYHPLTIRQIHLRSSTGDINQQVEKLLNIGQGEYVQVFIDLRLPQLSANTTKEVSQSIPEIKFISPFPTYTNSKSNKNSSTSVFIGGSIKGQMISIITKMKQAGSTLILPIIANNQRQKESFDIFSSVAAKGAPEISILPSINYPHSTSNNEIRSASSSSSSAGSDFDVDVVLDQVAEVCSKHPSVSVLLFSEGEVAQLLSATYRKPEVTDRVWYFPDGLFWEEVLKSRKDAWKVARKVGMVSAGFLGVNETGHFRHKRMMHLNSKLGKGSPLHATLAFDSLLVAFTSLVEIEKSQSNGTQRKDLDHLKFDRGISGDLTDVSNMGNRGSNGEYARAMLLPDINRHQQQQQEAKVAIDVLHSSPWLPDGVVHVNEAEQDEGRGFAQPLIKATTGHFLRKSYLKKFYEKSRALRCGDSTVKVQAMDFLTHAKIERRYKPTDFPEVLILPGDHGFTIQLLCHGGKNGSGAEEPARNNSDLIGGGRIDDVDDDSIDNDYAEDVDGDSVGVHFVCPPDDPIVRLPCIHSLTRGPAEEEVAGSVEYEEVPRELMQRYFDAFGLEENHPSSAVTRGSATPLKFNGDNLRARLADGQKSSTRQKRQIFRSIHPGNRNPRQEREAETNQGAADDTAYPYTLDHGFNQHGRLAHDYPQYDEDHYQEPSSRFSAGHGGGQRPEQQQSQFQRRKSSIPGGYDEMKIMHATRRQKPVTLPSPTSASEAHHQTTTEKYAYGGPGNYAGWNLDNANSTESDYGDDQTTDLNDLNDHQLEGDDGYVPQYNIRPLDTMVDQKIKELNASAFENLDSWYPTVLSKLAENYGIDEHEVQEVLKMTKGTYLPTLMRRDAAPVPAAKPPQKYPYPPYAKWLGSSVTGIGSCTGASLSCVFCTMLLEATGFVSFICNGACFVGIYGNCLATLGLLYSKVYASNSVICTELFRQGRLDLPTYMADAQFGARLRIQDKRVLDGYHTLAKPVVWAMQQSETVSNVVHAAATPWVKQMAHEEGLTADGSDIGRMMMHYGVPFCAYFNVVTSAVVSYWQQLVVVALSLGALAALRVKQI